MKKDKYYFIAIGGVGMSGLAKYLLENGCDVSGSDIVDSKYIQKLRDLGAKVYIGQKAENVPNDATVVASTAIRENNPEMVRARELGLTVYHRSDIWQKFHDGANFSLDIPELTEKRRQADFHLMFLKKQV